MAAAAAQIYRNSALTMGADDAPGFHDMVTWCAAKVIDSTSNELTGWQGSAECGAVAYALVETD